MYIHITYWTQTIDINNKTFWCNFFTDRASWRFYSSKHKCFLSTPETLLHPINGAELGSRTTSAPPVIRGTAILLFYRCFTRKKSKHQFHPHAFHFYPTQLTLSSHGLRNYFGQRSIFFKQIYFSCDTIWWRYLLTGLLFPLEYNTLYALGVSWT